MATTYIGTVRNGKVEFERPLTLPEGSQVRVTLAPVLSERQAAGAQGLVSSIPLAEIHTNLRTNIPDGGVDTRVTTAVLNDLTGWLAYKTIWQYKATEAKNIRPKNLKDETRKSMFTC